MIPKIIHSVWLSNDPKPEMYVACIKSWRKHMPEYEIKEWSLVNLPKKILEHKFVNGAINAKKWAYATDVIRLWALQTYGGIYMDMDVIAYRSFDPFLKDRAFSCIEYNPSEYAESIQKRHKEINGIGIEAGILGAEKNHEWINDIFHYYDNLEFINDPKYYCNYIMPRVINRISKATYGFIEAPIYQHLRGGVNIYPAETFSWIFNWKYLGMEFSTENLKKLGEIMPMRYACHLTLHSWWEGTTRVDSIQYKIKHFIYEMFNGRISKASLKKMNPFKKRSKY